jgi:hypothetical protein
MKTSRVTLSAEERQHLDELLSRGKADVRKLKHAQVLRRVDEGPEGAGWTDEHVAEAVGVGDATIERLRRRFVEDGFEAALTHYKGSDRVYRTKLDGLQEAHLITLACSQPPDGRARRRSLLHQWVWGSTVGLWLGPSCSGWGGAWPAIAPGRRWRHLVLDGRRRGCSSARSWWEWRCSRS